MKAAVGLGLIASLVLAATALAQEGVPVAPDGRALFVEKCGLCHLENGFGTRVLARRVPQGQAMLEQRENLAAPIVTLVVRRGMGSMPQIRAAELDEAQLAAIARYLETGE